MRNCFTLSRIWGVALMLFVSTSLFGQGFIDLTSNSEVTPWLPDGALRQTFRNVGTPPINVTVAVEGSTNRFINNTPRNDPRGLWLSVNLGSRLQTVSVTFTFSDPVTNLSFGILGIDRDLNFSNYQDRVAIEAYDDAGRGLTPTIRFNPRFAFLTDGLQPHIKVMSGFNVDALDSTLTTVNYRTGGVKRLTLTYGSGSDIRSGAITAQSIFLTNLGWSNIVPVELIYFRGKAENNRVRLQWATATEINSSHFDIERSTDLREFGRIGQTPSAGDSRQRIEYSFLDEAPLPGVNYYRLRQVDRDGTTAFSKIIAISTQSETSRFVIYPNPSDGQTVRLQFDNLELDELKLVNILGQEIAFDMEASSGNSLTIKPHRPLDTGLYFVTYASQNRARVTQKLWVSK
ncbi:MAG: T9SS type A sorting domain-containing protein [Runella sp.]